MSNLKPCPYRRVGDEGHILCEKIKTGDREVTPDICRACPVAAINCTHLRATLDHQSRPPITVRYGNGKSQVWAAIEPTISLQRAACAAQVVPIHSPHDCAGCAQRTPFVTQEKIATGSRQSLTAMTEANKARQSEIHPRRSRRAPVAQPVSSAPPAISADVRATMVTAKIIQLQEWLVKQNTAHSRPNETAQAVSDPPRARAIREEKRVGWTD